MKRELLKDMNLSDEQIDQIMSVNGADIEKAKGSSDGVESVKQENESLKSQLSERDKDIKALQKQAGNSDELNQKLTDLQDKYKADTEALQGQLQQTKLNGALNNALTEAKVRNPDTLKGLLNLDTIKLNEDGKLEGLDDQLAGIKQSDAYLFEGGTKTDYDPGDGASANDTNSVEAMVDVFKNGNQ